LRVTVSISPSRNQSHERFVAAVGDTGVAALCDALSGEGKSRKSQKQALALSALRFIDLRKNKIGEKGAVRLADAAAKGDLPAGWVDLEGNY
jgi:hypothetical protein